MPQFLFHGHGELPISQIPSCNPSETGPLLSHPQGSDFGSPLIVKSKPFESINLVSN
jgi:hypothetical protein